MGARHPKDLLFATDLQDPQATLQQSHASRTMLWFCFAVSDTCHGLGLGRNQAVLCGPAVILVRKSGIFLLVEKELGGVTKIPNEALLVAVEFSIL